MPESILNLSINVVPTVEDDSPLAMQVAIFPVALVDATDGKDVDSSAISFARGVQFAPVKAAVCLVVISDSTAGDGRVERGRRILKKVVSAE